MKRYTTCAAPGCFQAPRPFSRYCAHHYRKLERTRSLRGRVLRKGELKYPRAECLAFIEKRRNHPAVAAALAYMNDLLEDDGRATFLRREFNRLRDQGATPETMLASVMACYFWGECNFQWPEVGPPTLPAKCWTLNLGRALLGTVPAQQQVTFTGRTRYVRIRPGHAYNLGINLQQSVGLLCHQAVKKILKDSGHYAPDERGRLIKEAIERAPLDREEEDDNQPE